MSASALRGLSLAFAVYASELLARWIRAAGRLSALVWIPLALLAVSVVLSGTFNFAFEKTEVSGLPWAGSGGR